jgi:hypothetical protein
MSDMDYDPYLERGKSENENPDLKNKHSIKAKI